MEEEFPITKVLSLWNLKNAMTLCQLDYQDLDLRKTVSLESGQQFLT